MAWRNEQRLTQLSYANSPMITILIGPEEKVFHIHKALLCSQSPYCTARLSDSWKKDAGDGPMLKLPDIQEDTFGIIFNWLYTGRVSVNMKELVEPLIAAMIEDPVEGPHLVLSDWVELYRSADVLLLTNLQNQLVDLSLIKSARNVRLFWPFRSAIIWHEKKVAHTPYYQLCLEDGIEEMFSDGTAFNLSRFREWMKQMIDYPQLLADVLIKINEWRDKPWAPATFEDRCKYHVHEQGQTCGEE